MNDAHDSEPTHTVYPVGRGYGHDYMRGGEVFGGYGYSEREEYETPRGALGHKRTNELTPDRQDARQET
jgi:hypothetical protein